MLYNIIFTTIRYALSLASFFFDLFWFLFNHGIPWFTLLILIICIASKFVKLKSPNQKLLRNLLGGNIVDDVSYWPIANRGGCYDVPENSQAALKTCISKRFRNVLLDVGLTACGEIVILNRTTLDKAGLSGGINKHNMEILKKINITELHPLGSHYDAEYIITLTNLLDFLKTNNLTIFLFISDTSTQMLEKLKNVIRENEIFALRIILISRSPIFIYQLRKLHSEIICGLWTEKSFVLKAPTLIASVYGAIFRNIVAPVIGVSVVFINKDEFNLHIAELWRNVGIRPIVYKVNSPNEKRYFQKTMKTQYLTDSLRSEPFNIN